MFLLWLGIILTHAGEALKPTGAAAVFWGEKGKPVEGKSFTPPPRCCGAKCPGSSSHRYYREKKRKLPVPRQMLCTDIQVPAEEADKAFMRAWNFLVNHGLGYVELPGDGQGWEG